MIVEEINANNIAPLTHLMIALWPECSFKEEYENCQQLINSATETCYLLKKEDEYIGFIQLGLRTDHVEGAEALPVAYVEGIYVKEEYRKQGLGEKLISLASEWALANGSKQLASDAEIDNQMSIDFHKRIGFKEVNRVVCFIKNISE